jgi:hypothetical protein
VTVGCLTKNMTMCATKTDSCQHATDNDYNNADNCLHFYEQSPTKYNHCLVCLTLQSKETGNDAKPHHRHKQVENQCHDYVKVVGL